MHRIIMIVGFAVVSAAVFVLGYWFLPGDVQVFVRAVTFDSDLRATTTNIYTIGANALEWQSINNTLFFTSSSYVGISSSTFTPSSRVQVRDGNVYMDTYGYGIILVDTNGVCWRTFMLNSTSSVLTTATTTCP